MERRSTLKEEAPLNVLMIGSQDFCRQTQSFLYQRDSCEDAPLFLEVSSANLVEAWSSILSKRPDVLLVEIAFTHKDREQLILRNLLSQVRDRFGSEIYIVIALNSCENLIYGGDLLFQADSMAHSGLLNTFVAKAPGSIPSIPNLKSQILDVLVHIQRCRIDKDSTEYTATMGQSGWVQSLADPASRELWLRWLPRYATYINENPIIIGETGTGKTSLALAMHILSGRTGKFVSITSRDFSSTELVQAELFGAVSGAYTGAVDKWGLVKSAEKGTLFIDELQSIDKELQGKLITFIENKLYRRVGSAESIEADVRFVFASNMTLHEMIDRDILREDFAYRLERVQLQLPPLRKRRLDIASGIASSLAKVNRERKHGATVKGISPTAYRMLFAHSWAGNLRQLENGIAQLCEYSDMRNSTLIEQDSVLEYLESRWSGTMNDASEIISTAAIKLSREVLNGNISSVDGSVSRFIEIARLGALEASGGDIQAAAKMIQENENIMELFSKVSNSKIEAEQLK